MLGTCQRAWCPYCHTPAGPDCPSTSRAKRAERARERRAWRRDWADELTRERRTR